jgi:hypothetical protein
MDQQTSDINKKGPKNYRRLIWPVFILMVLLFLFWFITDLGNGQASSGTVRNAKIQAYLRQIEDSARIYYKSNGNYNNFNKSAGYIESCDNIIKKVTDKSYCISQISEKSYCVKAKGMVNDERKAYLCADNNNYNGGYITGDYCTSEKPYCEEPISLPQGYTLNNYSVEKKMEVACQKTSDCVTPAEYATQSRCPFVSLCLENKCTVVCPDHQN